MPVGPVPPSRWVRLPSAAGNSLALVVKQKGDGQANEHDGPQAERGDCDGGEMCEHERTRDVVDLASPTWPTSQVSAGFPES